jgi:hypothetical protein
MAGHWMLPLACPVIAVTVVVACGNGASSPDSCRQIEEARCTRAPMCNIPLEPPYSTSGSDVDACIRFYDTACLHGLDVPNPGPMMVNRCVSAIKASCSAVATPQSDPACFWLIPPASVTTDAAADATDATDAASEGGADAAEDTLAE